jgi:hypothetical protein
MATSCPAREYLDDVHVCEYCEYIVHESTSERHTYFACINLQIAESWTTLYRPFSRCIWLHYKVSLNEEWGDGGTYEDPKEAEPRGFRCTLIEDVKYERTQMKHKLLAHYELIRKIKMIWKRFDCMAYRRTITKVLSSMLGAELPHLVVGYL